MPTPYTSGGRRGRPPIQQSLSIATSLEDLIRERRHQDGLETSILHSPSPLSERSGQPESAPNVAAHSTLSRAQTLGHSQRPVNDPSILLSNLASPFQPISAPIQFLTPATNEQSRVSGGHARVRAERKSLDERVEDVLDSFRGRGGTGAFLERLFDPKSENTRIKNSAKGFCRSDHLSKVLDLWWDSADAHEKILAWLKPKAVALVHELVAEEMDALSARLLMRIEDTTPGFLLNFSVESTLLPHINEVSPITYGIIREALQTERAQSENKKKNPDKIAPVIMAQLAKHRSQNASLFAIPFGLTQWAAGVPRQCIDTCAQIGLSIAYSSITKAQKVVAERCMEIARQTARTERTGLSYDNMQVESSIYTEQRPEGPVKVLTGTMIMLYALRNATDEACLLQPIIARRNKLEDITFAEHVRPSLDTRRRIHGHQDIHIVEILLEFCPSFAPKAHEYLASPILQHASHRPPPKGHITRQFPLRASPTNESSTDGNIKIWYEAFGDYLEMDVETQFGQFAIPSINDQATNSNIRGAQALRKHDTSPFHKFDIVQPAPGFFHVQLNTSWYLLSHHRGSIGDHGSLDCFIQLLEKKRHGSAHPDFHALRATEFQVLSGTILHAWKRECGFPSLALFSASNPTPQALLDIARRIRQSYASGPTNQDPTAEGVDNIFRNTQLLLRDLLYFRTLQNAIKSGDFGRVEDLLGWFTIFFAGVGAPNYCSEFLHFIQNLRLVWTPEFADVMRDNMLINMSGRDDHWTGVDENIEHVLHVLQDLFASRGIHADWDHLANISPAAHVWRALLKVFRSALGVGYKGMSHSEVDTSSLVHKVEEKVGDWELLICKSSRGETEKCTVDAIEAGVESLMGGRLAAFHKRRRAAFVTDVGNDLELEQDTIPPIPPHIAAYETLDNLSDE
ncbi:hypothetical protein DENSPDRAFT_774774 [Dentipellis sp. KUC8613]|nr:hypothetical protein DENSPDRAFT_774774 [Dentipellis sp. KUC8613]